MSWVKVNGIDMHYVEAGSGQPLVFLHGNSSCGEAWFQQFDAFKARFRCIAYDSVNHGHSANSPRDEDEPDRVDELEGFLAALGIQGPILAGNSMGGNTALRWATRHPGDALALIISGAGVRPAAESMPATPKPMDVERLYIPFGQSFTPQFEAEQPDMHARYYRIRSTATRIEALRHPRKPSAQTVAERGGMIDAVKNITSPIQIITGDLDTALDGAQGLRDARPDARYAQMAGAPHNAYWEMAKEWNAVASAFLDSVMAATATR
ncbi:MAG: alpha/beta hydrolase [Dehalococcoidia bacterium]|nr:MAG: alpha/beta hydrolase [Dehalococcoidia bacterium]